MQQKRPLANSKKKEKVAAEKVAQEQAELEAKEIARVAAEEEKVRLEQAEADRLAAEEKARLEQAEADRQVAEDMERIRQEGVALEGQRAARWDREKAAADNEAQETLRKQEEELKRIEDEAADREAQQRLREQEEELKRLEEEARNKKEEAERLAKQNAADAKKPKNAVPAHLAEYFAEMNAKKNEPQSSSANLDDPGSKSKQVWNAQTGRFEEVFDDDDDEDAEQTATQSKREELLRTGWTLEIVDTVQMEPPPGTKKKKVYTAYIIIVKARGADGAVLETWQVHKRYSQFRELHNNLAKYVKTARVIKFAKKRYFGNSMAPAFIRQRREQLQTYLDAIGDVPEMAHCRVTLNFLKRDGSTHESGEAM